MQPSVIGRGTSRSALLSTDSEARSLKDIVSDLSRPVAPRHATSKPASNVEVISAISSGIQRHNILIISRLAGAGASCQSPRSETSSRSTDGCRYHRVMES